MTFKDKKWLWQLARLVVRCLAKSPQDLRKFDAAEKEMFSKTDEGWDIED